MLVFACVLQDALLKSAATSSGNITTFPTELALSRKKRQFGLFLSSSSRVELNSVAEDSDVSSHPIPQLSQLSQLSQLPMITADSAPSHSSTALLPTSTGGSILQHILGSVHGDTDDEIARKSNNNKDGIEEEGYIILLFFRYIGYGQWTCSRHVRHYRRRNTY